MTPQSMTMTFILKIVFGLGCRRGIIVSKTSCCSFQREIKMHFDVFTVGCPMMSVFFQPECLQQPIAYKTVNIFMTFL